jgi:hypothetical protein
MFRQSLAALLLMLGTAGAQAADNVLECKIHVTRGTNQWDYTRRYEIYFDTNSVVESINGGGGWTAEANLQLDVADNTKYVFSGDGIKSSKIDRHTGEYFQEDDRGIARGKCHTDNAGKQGPPIL